MRQRNRHWLAIVVIVPLAVLLLVATASLYTLDCVGSWKGPTLESKGRFDSAAIEKQLEADARHMCVDIGERNHLKRAALEESRRWIRERWESQGWQVHEQHFEVDGQDYANLEVELRGHKAPGQIVLVSAHYDTPAGSPGANDNASGMAVILGLGKLLRSARLDRTVRLVAFVNEEPPFFGTHKMGSYKYAERSRKRDEHIRVMISLDAVGIFKHEHGSQRLPFPFRAVYGDVGDYLAFLGDIGARHEMFRATRGFRKGTRLHIHAAVMPPIVKWSEGIAWGDYSSFWKFAYHGVVVTDTGEYRTASHKAQDDTFDKLDFNALTSITIGMYSATVELATQKN